jgi:UDP-GlcNAc:undecaprenyl-phosphate GlcNAc-1-phosphate transferase
MSSSIIFFALSLFSLGLNYILIQFSKQLGTISLRNDGQERWDNSKKPIIGGLSFYIGFLFSGLLALYFSDTPLKEHKDFLALLLVTTLGFFVGMVDDALTTKPLLKFSGQVLIGILIVAFGYEIQLFKNIYLDVPLTIFWTVGCLNSINMLDNMDGITGSVSFSILAAIAGIIFIFPIFSYFDFYLVIGVLGTLLGFLILNWNPSKLYMGDTGSQFLGALLAFWGVKYLWNLPTLEGELIFTRQILVAVLIFLAPIIDSTFVTVARLRRGQSPFVGGKDHTTHHFAFLGISVKIIPLFYIMVTALSSMLVFSSFAVSENWSHYYTVMFLIYIIAMYGLFLLFYQMGLKAKKMKESEPQISTVIQKIKNSVEKELSNKN